MRGLHPVFVTFEEDGRLAVVDVVVRPAGVDAPVCGTDGPDYQECSHLLALLLRLQLASHLWQQSMFHFRLYLEIDSPLPSLNQDTRDGGKPRTTQPSLAV